jgi:ribosome-associated protein
MRDLDLAPGLVVPAALLRAATSRSGGPGGQNVNKLETRVTIEAEVDALPLTDAQKLLVRSQLATRDRALARMEELLRDALAEREVRRPTRTPKAQKRRRLEAKKRRGETKKLRGRVE